SHCALALMGEGPVAVGGELMDAGEALRRNGIEPVVLHEKEGLALINGTDAMLGMLCLAIHDLRALATVADIAAAMSVEGLLGTDDVFAAPPCPAPAAGAGARGGEHAKGAEGQSDPRLARYRGLPAGAGCLLPALRAAGRR